MQFPGLRHENKAERDELDDVSGKTNGSQTFCHPDTEFFEWIAEAWPSETLPSFAS